MRLLLTFFLWSCCIVPAAAQSEFAGAWAFVPEGAEAPILFLELDEGLDGAGLVTSDIPGFGPAAVRVTSAEALANALDLQMIITPQDPAIGAVEAGFIMMRPDVAMLTLSGQVLEGRFEPAGQTGTAAEGVVEGDVCDQMMAVQEEVIVNATLSERPAIFAIYDQADRLYGVEMTTERCTYLLAELSGRQDQALASDPNSACIDVGPVLQMIGQELALTGAGGDGTVAGVLAANGLGSGDVWTEEACTAGVAALSEYLFAITAGTGVPAGDKGDGGNVPTLTNTLLFEVHGVSQTLNLREGPGTRYGVVYQLPFFARDIELVGAGCDASGWCNVSWNGVSGWVSERYIRPM